MTIRSELDGESWHGAPPASDESLERIRTLIGGELLPEYEAFLLWSNGGERRYADSYIVLWSAEEVDELNELYEVQAQVPGALGIGTDGGPGLLVYVEPTKSSKVALVPFDDLDFAEATATRRSLREMIVEVIASAPESPKLSWADRVDVYLVQLPANGMSGLAAIRRALALDLGLSDLRSACERLPALIAADVHHGQAKARLEKSGLDNLHVVELVKHGDKVSTPDGR